MQRIRSSETAHQNESTESQADSPRGPSMVLSSRNAWRGPILKRSTLLFMVLFFSILFSKANALRLPEEHQEAPAKSSNYDFHVFCPANDNDFKPFSHNDSRHLRLEIDQKDKSHYLNGRTYIVRTQAKIIDGKLAVQYCGKIRLFDQDCSKAVDECTFGPMFDIEARQSVDVIWVNNIDPSLKIPAAQIANTCMDPKYEPHKNYCHLKSKTKVTMTFDDPTTHPNTTSQNMRISQKTWPISTHVHGGEVRPAFDGNPLSWHGNDPNRKEFGTGMFSLSEKCYFDSFEQSKDDLNPPLFKVKSRSGATLFNYKVNRYPNKQNPGTLWYHDHGMRLTNFNVQKGLAGFYILRDTNVQKYLGVHRSNQKFVLITSSGNQNYDLNGLQGGTVYRFRFLNANYAARSTFRYSFSYNNCSKTSPDLESFTMIGADSSLFDKGIEKKTHFVISNGERIDLLIKFSTAKSSISICGDTDINVLDDPFLRTKSGILLEAKGQNSAYNIKSIRLGAATKDLNTRTDINKIDLSKWVAYEDLSKKPASQIAVRRFRTMMLVDETDTIGGRMDFHEGKSENPVIGSTQDWFMINAYAFGHPMHIHLINFQVMKVYDLKVLRTAKNGQGCSYYQMDYVAKALSWAPDSDFNITFFKYDAKVGEGHNVPINYVYLCDNLATIKKHKEVQKQLSQIYPENYIENGISGLDLFAKDASGNYKYVVDPNGSVSPKVEYSKWKDTVYIDGYRVLQLRTRWAKPDYNEAVDKPKGTYFHVPADQMREYPGYVYHCHILPHEDNEMMRPIMLQLPSDGPKLTGECPQFKWEDKVKCINKRCENTERV